MFLRLRQSADWAQLKDLVNRRRLAAEASITELLRPAPASSGDAVTALSQARYWRGFADALFFFQTLPERELHDQTPEEAVTHGRPRR